MGTQIQNIKMHFTTLCSANYKQIYVFSLPYSRSEMAWYQGQLHVQGIWNSFQLAISMNALHFQINAISYSRLQFSKKEMAN